jgi:tetratricopeptide (TPR) repeat protein
MKRLVILVCAAVLIMPAAGQQFEIDTNTPEGQLLQQIGLEEDLNKKAELLEQFAKTYPPHPGLHWVMNQLPGTYEKLNQPDKALEACERMLQVNPTNAAGSHACLKIAEAQKDPDRIRKWALLTHGASRKAVEAPKPQFKDKDEEEEWNQTIDFARQVGTYSEYSAYAAALQTTDPAKKIELAEALRQMNPESQYWPQLVPMLFLAYRQTGNTEKAVELAEQVLAKDATNEDMLLVVADYYMNQKKDAAKTLSYSSKLVDLMSTKPAPEGVSAADWEKKRKSSLGVGYWMMGVTYATQNKLSEADKVLRQALPFISDNDQLRGTALFYLGVVNYRLGEKGDERRILDAFNFTKESAAIKSPVQAAAQQNLKRMQAQYRLR